jgi:hypothetical protein
VKTVVAFSKSSGEVWLIALLTACSWLHLEKLIVLKLLGVFSLLYGT